MTRGNEHSKVRHKVLITGGEGFVGSHLINTLKQASVDFVIGSRKPSTEIKFSSRYCNLAGDVSIDLSDIKCVIHLGAIAHNKQNEVPDIELVNNIGTTKLAQQAVNQGVKQFIFLSSIGVLGNISSKPLDESAVLSPYNAYTRSKARAEKSLLTLSKNSDIQLCILRAPLVYGAHAKGSFAMLVKLVKLGLPLPFAGIQNKRSVCSVNTLTECIYRCISASSLGITLNPQEYFNVADDDIVSTPQICQAIANAINRPARLIKLPKVLLTSLLSLLNKPQFKASLLDDLLVDNTCMKEKLKWHAGMTERNIESELIQMLRPGSSIKQAFK